MLTPSGHQSYAGITSAAAAGMSEEKLLTSKLDELSGFRINEAPADLPALLKFLDDDCAAIREIAAGVLTAVFDRQSSRRKLTAAFRPLPFTIAAMPALQLRFSGALLHRLLAMASFNENGYIRYEALCMLTNIDHPFAIRFLLYRLNDPVSVIRDAAVEAIKKYQQPRFYQEFLQQLPLVEQLPAIRKTYMVHVYGGIANFLTDSPLTPEILRWVEAGFRNRQSLLIFHVNRWGITPRIRSLFLNDRDFQVRQSFLLNMTSRNAQMKKRIYRTLLADKCAHVRFHALRVFADRPGEIDARRFLADSCLRVRQLARRITGFDHEQQMGYYAVQLREGVFTPGLILGLGDNKVFRFRLFQLALSSPRREVVEAALVARARVNRAEATTEAFYLLPGATGSLWRRCITLLSQGYAPNIHRKLAGLYEWGDAALRKKVVTVWGHVKNWQTLPPLMQAALDPDEEVCRYARWYIRIWIRHPLSKKTRPSAADRLRIIKHKADINAMPGPEDVNEFISFWEFKDDLDRFLQGNEG